MASETTPRASAGSPAASWPGALGTLGTLVALLATILAALLISVPGAIASPRAQPPTAAAFHHATERLLERPAFRTSPRPSAGGDIGPDVTLPTIPGGLFPDGRFVTLYGAPQLGATELGSRSPRGAARRIVELVRPLEQRGDREVVPGFDLIGVVANSTPGPDRKYRTRQPDAVIEAYLEQARAIDGRLLLDIQPGRSSAAREATALGAWLAEPGVDIGIDPEWNVGRKGVPGQTTGSITAGEINATSRRMERIVESEGLPPKVLVVHQFTRAMIRRRSEIRQRDGVQVVLSFDGIGGRAPKEAGYSALATEGLFNGFAIFTSLDAGVMSPAAILALEPVVDFLLYQ